MTSLLASMLATHLSVWALSTTNPVTGKPWDRYLLPACQELIPERVQSAWQLSLVRAPVNLDSSNMNSCYLTRQGKDVTISYLCGGRHLEPPSDGYKPKPMDDKSVAKWLKDEPTEWVNPKTGNLHINANDDDTPCEVALTWPDVKGIEPAKRLMKDLLAAATPAVVGKPRLEAIYLDPQSAAGRAFFTSPEAWKKESAGLKDYIVLAAGFPKIVEGKAFPGLPEGKVALVGMCLIGDGGIAHTDALSGLQRALMDAQGAEPSCPVPAVPRTWWEVDGDTEIKLGQRTLVLNFFHDRGVTDPKTRARAYLREADGSLVSFAADELDLDPRAYEKDCKVTVKPGRSGATLKVHCKLGTPDRCKKNPWWSFSQTVRVSGNKVTIEHTEKSSPGDDCEPTYE